MIFHAKSTIFYTKKREKLTKPGGNCVDFNRKMVVLQRNENVFITKIVLDNPWNLWYTIGGYLFENVFIKNKKIKEPIALVLTLKL